MNTKLQNYFREYETFHQHPLNKTTHRYGIPLIVFSVFGLLAPIQLGAIDASTLLLVVGSLFYLQLSIGLGVFFVICLAVLCFAAHFLPFYFHCGLFVLGWILQLIGHYRFEKKSPAFGRNIIHLLIGPFWIFTNELKIRK